VVAEERPALIDDCTAAINAGGRGTRLGGVRKALLRIGAPDGETLLARALRVTGEIFPARLVVANEPEIYAAYAVPVVSDRIADRGAPAGLHAALHAATTPWVFLCACDMPAIDPRVVEALARRRGRSQACAAIVDGRPEPLHAFWSRDALPVLEEMLRAGEPSFKDVLGRLRAELVPLDDLDREVTGARRSFANVNTAEDLAAWSIFRA
jgi:molybdenum cofactor guanylyltransferase